MIVQVYGITTVDDARLVRECGVDNAGVVLDEGLGTWDHVDAPTARAIVGELAGVTVVGLSLATKRDAILRTIEVVEPHVAHLVRVTDEWSPDETERLRADLSPVQLMLTIGVRDARAIDVARHFAPVCDYVLLDTAHPATGTVGATGFTHDWALSAAVVAAIDTRVILAGGLGPDNVEAAIAAAHPAGVDSETRTSRDDDHRRKDPERVRRFVERARKPSVA